jgi:hypothetical protein
VELSASDHEQLGGLDRIERSKDRETEHEVQGDQGAMHGMDGREACARVQPALRTDCIGYRAWMRCPIIGMGWLKDSRNLSAIAVRAPFRPCARCDPWHTHCDEQGIPWLVGVA